MAILCSALNLLYIQVPATGCSVVAKVLREQFSGQDIGRKHDDVPRLLSQELLSEDDLNRYLVVANIRNPFDRLVTYYQRLNGAWLDEYFAYTVRDWERRRQMKLLSEGDYLNMKEKATRKEKRLRRRARIIQRLGFNTWVSGTVVRRGMKEKESADESLPVSNFLFPMLSHVNVALRQELLEYGLNAIMQGRGVGNTVQVPQKNRTPGKIAYSRYYNTFSRRLIEHMFAADLKFAGYTFDKYKGEAPLLYL